MRSMKYLGLLNTMCHDMFFSFSWSDAWILQASMNQLNNRNIPLTVEGLHLRGCNPYQKKQDFNHLKIGQNFAWSSFRSVFVDAFFRSRWPLQKGLTEQTSAVAQMRWEDAGILSEMGRKSVPSVNVVDAKITVTPSSEHDSSKKDRNSFSTAPSLSSRYHFEGIIVIIKIPFQLMRPFWKLYLATLLLPGAKTANPPWQPLTEGTTCQGGASEDLAFLLSTGAEKTGGVSFVSFTPK